MPSSVSRSRVLIVRYRTINHLVFTSKTMGFPDTTFSIVHTIQGVGSFLKQWHAGYIACWPGIGDYSGGASGENSQEILVWLLVRAPTALQSYHRAKAWTHLHATESISI